MIFLCVLHLMNECFHYSFTLDISEAAFRYYTRVRAHSDAENTDDLSGNIV